MGEIAVSIAGRQYRMACDEGEETRLGELAARLDGKIAELRLHFGEIGDQRITVMAALTMVDALDDAERTIVRLHGDIESLRASKTSEGARIDAVSESVAVALDGIAGRIAQVARMLDGGGNE